MIKTVYFYPVVLPLEIDEPTKPAKKDWKKLINEVKNMEYFFDGIKIIDAVRYKYKYLKLTLDVDLVEFNKRITKEYKNRVNDMVKISINMALRGGGYPSFL